MSIANGGVDAFALSDGYAPATLVVKLRLNLNQAGKTTSYYSINDRSVNAKEVRRLADFYNFEVENPCVINTQAVSASFLKEPKDRHARYAFFLRAANLESMKQDFLASDEQKTEIAQVCESG